MDSVRTAYTGPLTLWTPWWYRPSSFLLCISFPCLLVLALSDSSVTLSKAQLFYSHQDGVVATIFLIVLALSSRIAESDRAGPFFHSIVSVLHKSEGQSTQRARSSNRIGEQFFTEKFDWMLLGIFLVAHLIFFRSFFTNPGLIFEIFGGNLEIKKTLKTIPGVTTWTQVSILLAAIRGMRWAGVLPGNISLISPFHAIMFGTLFARALLWSERLALIEAIVPFMICAIPKVAQLSGRNGKLLIQAIPFVAPVGFFTIFVGFESLRSWQSYSGDHANVLEFGWKRLYTYYFEAMNTGAAILGVSGFYETLTLPLSENGYLSIYKGLYQKGILDEEFNNPSGIWYLSARMGNLLILPTLIGLGLFLGASYRRFVTGHLFGIFYTINFILMMEIVRVYYWPLNGRVLPTTLLLILILLWAASVRRRVREFAS